MDYTFQTYSKNCPLSFDTTLISGKIRFPEIFGIFGIKSEEFKQQKIHIILCNKIYMYVQYINTRIINIIHMFNFNITYITVYRFTYIPI